MEKYIAFDIGDKRIGIAVSDPFCQMALPVQTYYRKNFETDLKFLSQIAKEKFATKIVCGLPLNVDGTQSEQTLKTLSFIQALKGHTNLEIVTQDERFSTMEAHRVLISENMRRDKRKTVVDAVAATFILDDYMRKVKNINNK